MRSEPADDTGLQRSRPVSKAESIRSELAGWLRVGRRMYPKFRLIRYYLAFALVTATGAFAASSAKTYQVTGPILALTPTTITVQKGDETWEIARDADAKAEPALKVGDRVTVQYRMHATKIEAKGKADEGRKSDDASTASKRKKSS